MTSEAAIRDLESLPAKAAVNLPEPQKRFFGVVFSHPEVLLELHRV